MAKKATTAGGKGAGGKKASAKPRKPVRAAASTRPKRVSSSRGRGSSDFNAVDALLKLLESPLVAELLAVGATAALAAITETRYSRKTGRDGKSSKVVKAAGKAAAAAMGRRIATEFEEIRKVSTTPKASAGA